jgi:hypothetical protein
MDMPEERMDMPENADSSNILADLGDVTKKIIAFSNSPEYRELDAFYRRKSNFEILGIQRNEKRHSRFLAWLLDPSESHGLDTFGLKKFLEVCMVSRLESNQSGPPEVLARVLDELMVGHSRIRDADVKTELPVGKRGRIDVHVCCTLEVPPDQRKKLAILLENKVDSSEHDSQTVRYREWMEEHKADYDYSLLVYLTPVPTLKLTEYEEPDCKCKEFLQINYQYLVDYLIEPALALTYSEQARDFISDYLRALSVSSVIVADEANKGDVIMAISEHERKLLTAFWKKHKPLILAAFYAISSDPNQDEGLQEDAEKVLRSLGTKDYSPYTIALKGKVVASNVKKTAVGREVARVLIDDGITEPEFSRLRADKSSAFQLLKKESEITEAERKYNRYREGREEPLTFQGMPYHVSGNWGENNIPRFQKFLEQNFPQVELRKQDAEVEGVGDH